MLVESCPHVGTPARKACSQDISLLFQFLSKFREMNIEDLANMCTLKVVE